MLFQIILSIGILAGPKTGMLPEDPSSFFWVPLGLVLVWWRSAFVYMMPAAAIGSFGVGVYFWIVSEGANKLGFYREASELKVEAMEPLIVGFCLSIGSIFTSLHEQAIKEAWDSAYLISAICWSGWCFMAFGVVWMRLTVPFAPVTAGMSLSWAAVFGVLVVPVTIFYIVKCLWTKQPQPTFCLYKGS